MILCYLGLGSNLKTPERIIRQAIHALKTTPRSAVLQVAKLDITAPWGVQAQPPFCNTVLALKTTLPPYKLLAHCQQLEQKFGRVRRKRWGPRTLDIDILLYGNLRLFSPKLTIPHPFLFDRDFVLQPLKTLINEPLHKIVPALVRAHSVARNGHIWRLLDENFPGQCSHT
jgi:2-amino-4-hydroxy-6-hydroxymethyldihydropteridine diphosphokinase